MASEGGQEVGEIAFHHSVETVQSQLDSVIGDSVLRVVVGADLFGALACANHAAPLGTNGARLCFSFDLEQLGRKDLKSLRLVLML
jgi:hypothetical protein